MLVYNPYAWTKISNVIFLDWPAMTGFSFLRNDESYITNDIKSSKEIYNFLKQWLLDHPHFLSNSFYVGGNSYGGKMVPIVVHKVAEGIGSGQNPLINLQGYIFNNPVTSTILDVNSRSRMPMEWVSFQMNFFSQFFTMGLLISTTFCPGENYKRPRTVLCNEQIKIFRGFMNELMMDNFLTKKCQGESDRPELINAAEAGRSILKQKSTDLRSPPIPDIKCSTYASYLAYYWANDNDTRAALHVKENLKPSAKDGKQGTVKEWQICRTDFPYEDTLINSSIHYHHDLIARGYRALVFSGDHDLTVPFLGTMEWIGSLNLSIIEPWRSSHVNGQVDTL